MNSKVKTASVVLSILVLSGCTSVVSAISGYKQPTENIEVISVDFYANSYRKPERRVADDLKYLEETFSHYMLRTEKSRAKVRDLKMSAVKDGLRIANEYKNALGITRDTYHCDINAFFKKEAKACSDIYAFIENQGNEYQQSIDAYKARLDKLKNGYDLLEGAGGKSFVNTKNKKVSGSIYILEQAGTYIPDMSKVILSTYFYLEKPTAHGRMYQELLVVFKRPEGVPVGESGGYTHNFMFGDNGLVSGDMNLSCKEDFCSTSLNGQVGRTNVKLIGKITNTDKIAYIIEKDGKEMSSFAVNWDQNAAKEIISKQSKISQNSKQWLEVHNVFSEFTFDKFFTLDDLNYAVINGEVSVGDRLWISNVGNTYQTLSITNDYAIFKSRSYDQIENLPVLVNKKNVIKGQSFLYMGRYFRFDGVGFYRTVLGSDKQLISITPLSK